MSTVYAQPEKFGLTTVGEIEWSEPDYSFDLTVVWRAGDGTLYWGDDSGCSCPSPYEDVESLGDLSTGSFFDFAEHVNARLAEMRSAAYASDLAYAEPRVVELLMRLRSGGA